MGDPTWNLANGAADFTNPTFWVQSATSSGVTATRVAVGVDAAGVPFVDYAISGTATANGAITLNNVSQSRNPTVAGQTRTVSLFAHIISGTVPTHANTGIRLDINGLTAVPANTEGSSIPVQRPTAETLVTFSFPFANANTTQSQCLVNIRTEGGQSVNYTVRIKGFQFEQGPVRTSGRYKAMSPAEASTALGRMDGPTLTTGLLGSVNHAVGATEFANNAFWVETASNNGVTATRVAVGVDAAGVPYADYAISGTATAISFLFPYWTDLSRTPSAAGQVWTLGFFTQIISGTVPASAGSGFRADIVEELAPTTYLNQGSGSIVKSTSETLTFLTRALTSPTCNQVRGAITIRTETGDTVNYTVRIKGFQFEQGPARKVGQYRTLTAAEARKSLGLAAGATTEIGTTSGTIPVLGVGNVLPASVIPATVGARLIRTVNITSAVAAVDFTSADMNLNMYSDFILLWRNLRPTAAAHLWLRTSSDGGLTFAAAAGSYAWSGIGTNSTANSGNTGATSATAIGLGFAFTHATVGGGASGSLVIYGCDRPLRQKVETRSIHWRTDNALESNVGGGMRLADAVTNGVRLLMSSGSINADANASVSLYGVAK